MVNPTQAKLLQAQLEETQARLIHKKQALTKLGLPTYTLHERDYNPGLHSLSLKLRTSRYFSQYFPLLLFAIAALVSLTTMMRFVEEERINIGTLKALGYSNFDVSKKFLLYSLVASGLGVALGASLGFRLLPQLIFKAYTTNLTLSQTKLLFSWTYLLATLLVAISCTTVAALVALRKTLSEKPAQLLLPKPPKKALKSYWNALNFFGDTCRLRKRLPPAISFAIRAGCL
ncbi:ABC transporter permease [Ligilactobacillus agilis]